MNIIITKDYEDMSQIAASYLLHHALYNQKKRTNIAITAGKTPIRMYEIISPLLKNQRTLDTVYFYNFDEIPVKGQTEGITLTNLRSLFYNRVQIKDANILILDDKNYRNYDKKIAMDGGIDLLMLGLGEDGHFCGNIAGTLQSFDEETHLVYLKDYPHVAKRVSRFFINQPEKQPEHYVTFGAKTAMNCKEIVMIASGVEKAAIVRDMLLEPMSLHIPSSIFRLHPNFTLIIDEAAASLYKDALRDVAG